MTDPGNNIAQLRLWQLISPALPVGAFAYSQGLEYAAEAGWVKNENEAYDWIKGVAENALVTLDLPVMARLYRAWQSDDRVALNYWGRFLIASRESGELLAETRSIGRALATLLSDLDIEEAKAWRNASDCSFPLMFTLASFKWGITVENALMGYLWTWCENQVAAGIKIIPLGQTAGQRLLLKLTGDMPLWCEKALRCEDHDIGILCPGLAIASALHETQYSRLFRS